MSILFSVVFCKVLESYAGIGVGICFGIALGVPHLRDVSSLSEKEVRNCFQEKYRERPPALRRELTVFL